MAKTPTDKEVLSLLEEMHEKHDNTFLGDTIYDLIELIKENEGNALVFLQTRYGDKGLKYGIDASLFTDRYFDIELIVDEYIESAKKHIELKSFLSDAVWLGQQICIQDILLELNALEKKEVLYA